MQSPSSLGLSNLSRLALASGFEPIVDSMHAPANAACGNAFGLLPSIDAAAASALRKGARALGKAG